MMMEACLVWPCSSGNNIVERAGTVSRELEEFAEHVRRQCTAIMGSIAAKNEQRTLELAGVLCTKAANLANQKQMQQEVNEPNRYDLAALPIPNTGAESE
jgi:hypothetical protein